MKQGEKLPQTKQGYFKGAKLWQLIVIAFCVCCFFFSVGVIFSHITQQPITSTEINNYYYNDNLKSSVRPPTKEPVLLVQEPEERTHFYITVFFDKLTMAHNFSLDQMQNFLYYTFIICEKYEIPNYIPFVLAAQESNFKIDANSFAGAKNGRGLFQVSDICLEEYNKINNTKLKAADLYDMRTNFEVSLWYWRYLSKTLKLDIEDIDNIYMAYNCGPEIYKKSKDLLLKGKHPNGNNYTALVKFKTTKLKVYEALNEANAL